MIGCECAGTCSFLVIDHWAAREDCWDDEFYADLFIRPGHGTFRWRLKAAKRALLGQQIGHDMTIATEQAQRLRDWLTQELSS